MESLEIFSGKTYYPPIPLKIMTVLLDFKKESFVFTGKQNTTQCWFGNLKQYTYWLCHIWFGHWKRGPGGLRAEYSYRLLLSLWDRALCWVYLGKEVPERFSFFLPTSRLLECLPFLPGGWLRIPSRNVHGAPWIWNDLLGTDLLRNRRIPTPALCQPSDVSVMEFLRAPSSLAVRRDDGTCPIYWQDYYED